MNYIVYFETKNRKRHSIKIFNKTPDLKEIKSYLCDFLKEDVRMIDFKEDDQNETTDFMELLKSKLNR